MLFALDSEGVCTLAEGKGLDDLGIAPNEIIGRSVFDMFPSQPEVHESVRKALAGEPATSIVGINTVFEARLSPVRDKDGDVTGVIGVATDITERKQAEEALRESEKVLKAIVESTADGILVVNSSGQVIYSNELFAKMWRIPDELLATRDDEKLLAHVIDQLEDPEGFLAKAQELYHTSQEASDLLLFKDGRVFERFSRPLLTESDATGRVWSFRDVTERRWIQEEINVLARFPAENPSPVLRIGQDGTIMYANDPSLSLLHAWGCEIGQPLRKDWQPLISEVLASGSTREVESDCGNLIFSIIFAPVAEAGYVNLYGRDITESKRAEQALRDAANHDPLTGLLNRRAGNAAIEERLTEAQSNGKSFAMLVLDLDRFKSINDSFGHETGDAALVQFADVLSKLVGESGIVCRIGGDEFGIGMEDVDEDQAFSFARRVQTSLRHALASSDSELRPQFTVSIGIACYPDDGDNMSVLGRRADRAMYEAKVAGCNTSRAWRQIDSSQAA